MKRILAFISILFLFAALQVQFALAGTHYDQTVNKLEGEDWALYWGVIDFSDDSTGTYYTQAFAVEELNGEAGGLQAYCTNVAGTEDVNVALLYSNTMSIWATSTTDILDQVQTTTKIDSVGDDPNFYKVRYAQVSVIGQSGNPAATDCYWFIFLDKKPRAPRKCTAVFNTQ